MDGLNVENQIIPHHDNLNILAGTNDSQPVRGYMVSAFGLQ